MKKLISKIFLVVTLVCASGFAFAATTLNANSTQAEVDAAVQAAGSAGFEALSIELANAQVPTQFILNSVARYYGISGLQVVVNSLLNANSTQAEVDAAVQAAGSAGFEALSIELANAQVPTQFILNSVARYYGVSGLQVVVNSFVVLGMQVAALNTAANAAIIANGLDPAAFTPATGAGGGAAPAGVGFTPVPSGTGAVSPT